MPFVRVVLASDGLAISLFMTPAASRIDTPLELLEEVHHRQGTGNSITRSTVTFWHVHTFRLYILRTFLGEMRKCMLACQTDCRGTDQHPFVMWFRTLSKLSMIRQGRYQSVPGAPIRSSQWPKENTTRGISVDMGTTRTYSLRIVKSNPSGEWTIHRS
ncbi:hypothetical protein DFJ58DRAFT_165770 [Suillus subalutaceus]|uniref:uncharacterized protein n=1 Tax=Suillus subalutaceus TaxID=48586 RepID=UPI001B85F932|nr:uncharacterized protein DFJ58DRAFT_165770 [Suillus subalutaceus]KAG1865479.1 hypothetical protein DFJ58DRAFT_165770 [Suillus subalutaceus]